MKHLILFCLIALIFNPDAATSQQRNDRPVILELFTSQGCSSCTPADALLSEVKNRYKNDLIIALSYHVDYRNYLGWKDPFSNSSFTEKQRAYAYKLKTSSLYTPQIVVNGKKGFVGSRRVEILNAIRLFGKGSPIEKVNIEAINRQNQKLLISATVKNISSKIYLRYLLVIEERTTSVERGENGNLKLTNSNIVVAENKKKVTKEKMNLELIIPDFVMPNDNLRVVLLLEDDEMTILHGTQKGLKITKSNH